MAGDLYKQAGVDIDAGNAAVARMRPAIRATFTPNVLADVGSFGGLYALTRSAGAAGAGGFDRRRGDQSEAGRAVGPLAGIGHDIVNHCVNDILVQNARPLFFLDYVAASKLDPEQVARW